ncbi:MAG: twin-arginine translocation signal domain-containing protein [Pseudomonadota bacterium]|nr:twin-arginine translocation signal domain-containing protein [Pseudomonadota bacterium]
MAEEELSRRDLLKQTAATAAGMALPGGDAATSAAVASNALSVAIDYLMPRTETFKKQTLTHWSLYTLIEFGRHPIINTIRNKEELLQALRQSGLRKFHDFRALLPHIRAMKDALRQPPLAQACEELYRPHTEQEYNDCMRRQAKILSLPLKQMRYLFDEAGFIPEMQVNSPWNMFLFITGDRSPSARELNDSNPDGMAAAAESPEKFGQYLVHEFDRNLQIKELEGVRRDKIVLRLQERFGMNPQEAFRFLDDMRNAINIGVPLKVESDKKEQPSGQKHSKPVAARLPDESLCCDDTQCLFEAERNALHPPKAWVDRMVERAEAMQR